MRLTLAGVFRPLWFPDKSRYFLDLLLKSWWRLWSDRGQMNVWCHTSVASYGCLRIGVGFSGSQLEYFGSVSSFFIIFVYRRGRQLLWQTHSHTSPLCYLWSTNAYETALAIYCLEQWNIQQREPNISLRSRWKPNIFTEGPSADECQALFWDFSSLSPVLICKNTAELCLWLLQNWVPHLSAAL